MKKFISLLLALTFVLAFATTAYGAELTLVDADNLKLIGKVSDIENNEFTLSFYLVGNEGDTIKVPVDSINWSIGLGFDNSALTLKKLPTLGYGATLGTNAQKLNDVTNAYYLEIETASESELTITSSEAIAVFTFTVAQSATTVEDFTLNVFEISDTDFNTVGTDYSTSYSIDKVTLSTTPSVSLGTPTTEKEVTVGDTKYTNVYTCEGNVSVTNLGTKNVKLTPYAKLNGEDHTLTNANAITIPNAQFEGGNVAFKFVLIGAPTTGVEFGANYELVD